MITLDASAAVELVLQTPTGARVAARIGNDDLHVPHLIDLEVTSVLRRLESSGAISIRDAAAALDDYLALDLERHPHDIFLERIWQLRSNLTSYDGCYVALAETLQAPLVTCDARLARAPGHRAQIELI